MDAIKSTPYDFEKDKKGEVKFREFAEKIVNDLPLTIKTIQNKSITELKKLVELIIERFKEAIEHHGHWNDLYYQNKVRPEKVSQRIFFTISRLYCEANKIEVSPECNHGRGPVDFKFSGDGATRIVVEIKLSSSSKLIQGYSAQLPAYIEDCKADFGYYVVIGVTESDDKKFQSLFHEKNKLAKGEAKIIPPIFTVDGSKKDSASKLKTKK